MDAVSATFIGLAGLFGFVVIGVAPYDLATGHTRTAVQEAVAGGACVIVAVYTYFRTRHRLAKRQRRSA